MHNLTKFVGASNVKIELQKYCCNNVLLCNKNNNKIMAL